MGALSANCKYCGEPYEPTDPDQKYCRVQHQRRANTKRKRRRDRLDKNVQCPTPYKKFYSSTEQFHMINKEPNQEAYRCRCGGIHGATKKRVKNSLRGGWEYVE